MFLLAFKRKHDFKVFIILLFAFKSIFCVNIFSQENNLADEILAMPNNLIGVWENGGRFIEFSNDENKKAKMRIVLKPFYRFVFQDEAKLKIESETLKGSNSQFYLKVKYALTRTAVVLPLCIEKNLLFTSFYKKIPYMKNGAIQNSVSKKNILDGFWVEQGSRNGILLYPNEIPQHIDAYFFTGESYIKFRYWLDDLEYTSKKARVKTQDGPSYEFPKFLKRGESVYSCISSNGTVLRNFETGIYSISHNKNLPEGKGLLLSFKKQGAGPGSHASGDPYPHKQFIAMEDLPLYICDNDQIFAIGDPYLVRSAIKDLDAEIKKHNAQRRKSQRKE